MTERRPLTPPLRAALVRERRLARARGVGLALLFSLVAAASLGQGRIIGLVAGGISLLAGLAILLLCGRSIAADLRLGIYVRYGGPVAVGVFDGEHRSVARYHLALGNILVDLGDATDWRVIRAVHALGQAAVVDYGGHSKLILRVESPDGTVVFERQR
jgi:hypothetical protein